MRCSLRPLVFMPLGLALVSCTPSSMSRLATGGDEPDPQAEIMLRQGDYEGARQRYEFLARSAQLPDYFWLQAADAAFRAGDGQSAQQLVDAIHPGELGRVDRNQYLLLASRLDLNAGRARDAMVKLNSLSGEPLTGGQSVNYHTARASAYNQLGDMFASAKERVILANSLKTTESVRKNNEAIYDVLSRLPLQKLRERQPPPPDVLGGWMQLVYLFKTTPAANLQGEVDRWRATYPRHSANGPFLASLVAEAGNGASVRPLDRKPGISPQSTALGGTESAPLTAIAAPPKGPFIGVMLPLSGPLASAAQAIRTGMTAAYSADSRPDKVHLHFVDTASGEARSIYGQLVESGATAVVGPLVKDNVSALADTDLSVPVLALNQVPGVYNPKLYQFGLAPENEVEQAAGSAWFDGRQNALVLAPESQFGQRMVKYFTSYWKTLGGKVLATKTYAYHGQDLATSVKSLLSTQPAVDAGSGNFVFLVADASDARHIVPELNAPGSGALPIYALSHVYSGKADPEQDLNLRGLIFCDIPWLLNPDEGGALSAHTLESQITQTPPDVVKLIALGLDAYRLLPELERFRSDAFYRFSGGTGNLSLQSGNRIQRQLECAQFESGQLQLRGQAPLLQQGPGPEAQTNTSN